MLKPVPVPVEDAGAGSVEDGVEAGAGGVEDGVEAGAGWWCRSRCRWCR